MRKEQQMVGSRLPADLIRDLELIERVEQSDRSTVVRKLLQRAAQEWKLEHYARQYAEGRVSTAQAAEACNVSLWEMMDYFRQHKVPSQYDLEEWQEDVLTLRRNFFVWVGVPHINRSGSDLAHAEVKSAAPAVGASLPLAGRRKHCLAFSVAVDAAS